jgi:hypothetical protein
MLADLAYLAEVIGAIAVVISLFYVASQIRQNTRAVKSATAQSVHEHFRDDVENDIMQREPHPDARPMGAFSIGSQPGADAS